MADPFQNYGTGALPLPPDVRDWSALLHPAIAQALHVGTAPTVRLGGQIGGLYDQGAEGACFPAGTLIRMADGSERAIESVALLDEVLTAEGRTGTVLQTMVRAENEALYAVELWGHRHLQMTAEHPVLTRNGYRAAKALEAGDWVRLPRYLPETRSSIHPAEYLPKDAGRATREGRFRFARLQGEEEREARIDPLPEELTLDADLGRIIGLFLAEGHTTAAKTIWTFGPSEAKTLAQELTILLRERLGVEPFVQVRGNSCVNICLFGKHWMQFFEGLCATGSGKKRLHPDLCSGPREFLQSVYEGWMDGDGYDAKSGRRTGVTVSHSLALAMFDIAQGLGQHPTIQRSEPPPAGNVRTRRVRWDVYTQAHVRHKIGWEQDDGAVWRRVREVVRTDLTKPVWVYNLHVEGDNSYVAEGVGVHNCVAYSEAGVVSREQTIQGNPWAWMDAENLYRRNGGQGSNGVDTRQTLEDIRANGINPRDGGSPVHISAYLFVPKDAALWEPTIMAALSVGKAVTLATYLPANFGWDSSGAPDPNRYHQIYLDAGDPDWWEFTNSWGPNFGQGGRGRLPKRFVDPTRGDVYAYIVTMGTDIPIPVPPIPVPPVPVPPIPTPGPANWLVQGNAKGTGTLTVGAPLTLSGAAFQGVFVPTETHMLPGPDPGPDPIPTPIPTPTPDPNDDITVMLTCKPSAFRNTLSVIVYTADRTGHSFPASVNGTVTGSQGTVPLEGRTTHGTTSPVIWQIPRPAPWAEQCIVTIHAFNGSSTGSATKPG